MFQYTIDELIFKDGSTQSLPRDGVTIIVGPNNSGKSVILREIEALAVYPRNSRGPSIALDSLTVTKSGSAEDLISWIESRGWRSRTVKHSGEEFYGKSESPLTVRDIRNTWRNSLLLDRLREMILSVLPPGDRLHLGEMAEAYNPHRETASHPLHFLVDDPALMQRFNGLVARAFGMELSIDPYDRRYFLRLGKVTQDLTPPPPPRELLQEFEALPLISEQGDGIRAFVGLLLYTLVKQEKVVLIDEPEAFLHPPQARLLGRILVDETSPEGQLIIATHSQDFLQGVLESTSRAVQIIRLNIDAGGTRSRVSMSPAEVRELWTDPLLRYSNLLDGLFHRGVVVCEGDSDCRFYSAVLDQLMQTRQDGDLLFTHVGGKGRLKKAIAELRKFGILVAALADIDLLNDATLLRGIVEAAEGDWDALKADHRIVSSWLSSQQTTPKFGDLVALANKITNADARDHVTREVDKGLREALRGETGWASLKKGGQSVLPGGEVYNAATRLIEELAHLGIFIVPVGELERWVPEISASDKQRWLVNVLEGSHHKQPSPQLARYVRLWAAYLGIELSNS
jgi:hypothetical protein